MPFGGTAAGDVFPHNIDECFGKIKYVIVVAVDTMVVGYKQNHSNNDQALTTLLETTRRCNVKLNYEMLQCKKDEVVFLVKPTPHVVANKIKAKYQLLLLCLCQPKRSRYSHSLG